MLPFLKSPKANVAGIIIKKRTPDKSNESEDLNDDTASIDACAQDLIDAVHAKDVKAAASAIKSAFEILDSMPHEEGEHTEPHSYDAQNQEAAKQQK